MLSDLLEVFKFRFESLGGSFASAHDPDEAARLVAEFLRRNRVQSVFLSNIPSELEPVLTKELRRAGVSIFTKDSAPDPIKIIEKVDAGVSTAACAIAETGSLVEVAFDDLERLLSSLPKTYVSFFKKTTVLRSVHDVAEAIRRATERKTSTVTFISGPSRSGDIEQRLVMGIHGPHAVLSVALTWL